MSRHTPGPWWIGFDPIDDRPLEILAGHDDHRLAFLASDGDPADARLIAASPDLKDGCNAMLGLIQLVLGRDDLSDELRAVFLSNHRIAEAKAAVAKATQP